MRKKNIPETSGSSAAGRNAAVSSIARRVLGGDRRPCCVLLLVEVFEKQVAHLHFPHGCWYTVDAYFNAGSKPLRLEMILGSKSSGSLSDWKKVSMKSKQIIFHQKSRTFKLQIFNQSLLLLQCNSRPLLDRASVCRCRWSIFERHGDTSALLCRVARAALL